MATRTLASALVCALSFALGACAAAGKRPLGASCDTSTECESALCLEGACVDPSADDDNDGLVNALEAELGSDAANIDSDADGTLDPDELGDGLALVDSDGDGKPDIVESALGDSDEDCVTDQFDDDDATPDADPSRMVPAVCPSLGICGVGAAQLAAACPDGVHAVCVFGDIPGYADPELACDGRDENCDGTIDEGFPKDCAVAPRPNVVGQPSAVATLASPRYRATLVVGPGALGAAASPRFKAHLGAHPSLTDLPASPETTP